MTINENDKRLSEQLVKHLQGGEAFTTVDNIINKITFEKLGEKPAGLPYSFYQQFYHLKFAQFDILEFSTNSDYKSPKWPEGYWPKKDAPESEKEWQDLKDAYFKEREEFCSMIQDRANDLFKLIPHGSGQTLFREALLIVEHTAYHTGQLLILLRLLKLYP